MGGRGESESRGCLPITERHMVHSMGLNKVVFVRAVAVRIEASSQYVEMGFSSRVTAPQNALGSA